VIKISTVEENRLRRQAKRLGLIIKKSRGKKWKYDNQLGYMILDIQYNAVIAGDKFDLTFDEVEEWLNDYEEKLKSQS
jgi:hypothetical protein